ncbi:MAG TPA: AmmeMemoRadiSam system protein B [Bryobacteraceae bacterium]|nr:AmmeMemoRadiSam system protein B [Bryobacteraceae bacterium]
MLPRLRPNLDFFPSPVEERPGLVIRDPYQYSDATLIVPPALVACLEFFDGESTDLDLREYLVQLTGDLQIGDLQQHLIDSLSAAGFLEDEKFAGRKAAAEQAFADQPARAAAHAGGAYPDEPGALSETLRGYLDGAGPSRDGRTIAIAAPHVSPFGGVAAYRAAYSALSPADADRTFVVLGTSHYGAPERFGLTRKPFTTPFGETSTALSIVNEIAASAGDAVTMEDYCHAIEHSIEFQVIFLQHLFGPRIRVVPILCGAYARSIDHGGLPEQDEGVRRVLGALGEIAAREGDRLLWVLGVDMAHAGRRYGDDLTATAGQGGMEIVARRDQERIRRIESGDARGFWDLVQENHDDLNWCGSAPIYTFLKSVPGARGQLLQYGQWNIDPHSVVSFAGIEFHSH